MVPMGWEGKEKIDGICLLVNSILFRLTKFHIDIEFRSQ